MDKYIFFGGVSKFIKTSDTTDILYLVQSNFFANKTRCRPSKGQQCIPDFVLKRKGSMHMVQTCYIRESALKSVNIFLISIIILYHFRSILQLWKSVLQLWKSILHLWKSILHLWISILHLWKSILHLWKSILHLWKSILQKWKSILQKWKPILHW